MKNQPGIVATIFFLSSALSLPSFAQHDQFLMSDDFAGVVIDTSKWTVYAHPSGGGNLTQNGQINWIQSGTVGHTGHGLITLMSFADGGVYTIEGDYTMADPASTGRGEAGSGVCITRLDSPREPTYYGYPLHSIQIDFTGAINYQGASWGDNTALTTKDTITGATPSGRSNTVFNEFGSSVHLKIEIDTDNGTIRCYANHGSVTYSEGEIPSALWNDILNGTGHFRVEEFRSWAMPTSSYGNHSLDNWSIRKVNGSDCNPCDTNGDGEINALDLARLVNVILGVDDCTP